MTSESSSSVGGEKVVAGTRSGRLLGRYVVTRGPGDGGGGSLGGGALEGGGVTRGVVTSTGGGGAACGSWSLALPGGGESRQVLAQPSKLGNIYLFN